MAAELPSRPRIVDHVSSYQGVLELCASAMLHPESSVVAVVTGCHLLWDARRVYDVLRSCVNDRRWSMVGLEELEALAARADGLIADRWNVQQLVGDLYGDLLISGLDALEHEAALRDDAEVRARVVRVLKLPDDTDLQEGFSLALIGTADEARRLLRAHFIGGRRDLAALKQLAEQYWLTSISSQLEEPAFIDVQLPEELEADLTPPTP